MLDDLPKARWHAADMSVHQDSEIARRSGVQASPPNNDEQAILSNIGVDFNRSLNPPAPQYDRPL